MSPPIERHAFRIMDQKRAVCGETKERPVGANIIDALLDQTITCAACLRILSEAVIGKMRRLGVNLTPENAHHCAASISLRTELLDLERQLGEIRRAASDRLVPYERARREFAVATEQIKMQNAQLSRQLREVQDENSILRRAHTVAVRGPGAQGTSVGVALEVTRPPRLEQQTNIGIPRPQARAPISPPARSAGSHPRVQPDESLFQPIEQVANVIVQPHDSGMITMMCRNCTWQKEFLPQTVAMTGGVLQRFLLDQAAHTCRVEPLVAQPAPAPADPAPKIPAAKPTPPEDDDAASRRFSLIEID